MEEWAEIEGERLALSCRYLAVWGEDATISADLPYYGLGCCGLAFAVAHLRCDQI
jgi:hypothetical protein